MNKFYGIRLAQSKLMGLLTSEGYRNGTLAPSTQDVLDGLIEFCGAYEEHRRIQEMNDGDFEHYHNQMDEAHLEEAAQ